MSKETLETQNQYLLEVQEVNILFVLQLKNSA